MDPREHIELGKIALELNLLDVETLCGACMELAVSEGDLNANSFWVERGYLGAEQLSAVKAFLEARRQLQEESRAFSMNSLQSTPKPASDAQVLTRPTFEFLEQVGQPPGAPVKSQVSLSDVLHTIGSDDEDFPEMQDKKESEHSQEETPVGGLKQAALEHITLPAPPFVAHKAEAARASRPHNRVTRERYIHGVELGRGGGGQVLRAFDRAIGRSVAMKILGSPKEGKTHSPRTLKRFIAEAQTAGQLEHPNIIPIYDMGVLSDGRLYYTMKEVRRHSLREVLQSLRRGDELLREEYAQVRMFTIFLHVCQAMDYAHVRGVVHRDLKPDNIMLGDYGEVLVTDWGLARVVGKEVVTDFSLSGGDKARRGQTLGTPAYMPPEQARGALDEVDERSDVYALGAILYEILTLEPPYTGETPFAVMLKVVDEPLIPPSRRVPSRSIPEEMEAICLKAMARRKQDRFNSVHELRLCIEDVLQGVHTREAARRNRKGAAHTQSYFRILGEMQTLDRRAREAEQALEGWEPVESKRLVWQLQDEAQVARHQMARAFGEAVTAYTQALAYDNDNEKARQGLTQLYWSRFKIAEATQAIVDQIYFDAMLRQFDDGTYLPLLEGHGGLSLATFPEGAEVFLQKVEESDRRLLEGPARYLGRSPLLKVRMPMGSYLLTLRQENQRPLVMPLQVSRCRELSLAIDLLTDAQIGQGFVHIPSGECIIGGDLEAYDPAEREEVFLDSFLIAKYPVTFREYLTFVSDVWRSDPQAARLLLPRTRSGDGVLVRFDAAREGYVPSSMVIEGQARERYPEGAGAEWNLPVVGVDFDDVLRYIQWRSQRDGVSYRLPTEWEWEKAGRGVDGRLFPWGNHFEPTFCKMLSSRPETAQPEPVGSFPVDQSPYGVRDMAGGVCEWVADMADPSQPVFPDSYTCPMRGGGWNQDAKRSRLASRARLRRDARHVSIGFRLAKDVDPRHGA